MSNVGLLLLSVCMTIGCRPIATNNLIERSYELWDYELTLEGDWENDTLQTFIHIIPKRGKSTLTGFEISPPYFLFYKENRLTVEDTIVVQVEDTALLKVIRIPKRENNVDRKMEFVINGEKEIVNIVPTNFFIPAEDIEIRKPQIFSKKENCFSKCVLSITSKYFDSITIFDKDGGLIKRKVFKDDESDFIDIMDLVPGDYLFKIDGQYPLYIIPVQMVD